MKLEKITNSDLGPNRRRYDDACGTAHGLELIGERWALLVLRELLLGPKRFSDLRADLPGISANVLTQRLEGLEASGLLVRRRLPPPVSAQVYELTPWGYEVEPIVQTLGRWAARSPTHDPTLPISATSIMLSLRTMFSPERARGLRASIGFRLGHETFLAELEDGVMKLERGDAWQGQAIFTGPPERIAAAIYGKVPFDQLEPALVVTGDQALAEHFRAIFELPPKAEVPAPNRK
ncbi:MAG TPA: helix-turn-helix domain-containing protein [Allosphingosinicella sp.]|jgi:DNA-binding HxlR family transcriptional regulator|uniref:winged helix-turn-helix transcriptional regulator n=1 Tax=Allosphingosinicella sp. TaxID=2823234 RepID=UPI002F26E9B5